MASLIRHPAQSLPSRTILDSGNDWWRTPAMVVVMIPVTASRERIRLGWQSLAPSGPTTQRLAPWPGTRADRPPTRYTRGTRHRARDSPGSRSPVPVGWSRSSRLTANWREAAALKMVSSELTASVARRSCRHGWSLQVPDRPHLIGVASSQDRCFVKVTADQLQTDRQSGGGEAAE